MPAANRVYAESSADLGLAELEAVLSAGGHRFSDLRLESLAGIRYIRFSTDAPDQRQLKTIGRLSVAYALFEHRDGGALAPVALPPSDVYDTDLLTIARYVGKTNEYFTKLLVNLTAAVAGVIDTSAQRSPTVLDPLAGRGTTLNQAAVYGWHGVGVEIDAKDCEAYATFITTWLKNKRLPHKARQDALRVDNTKVPRTTVEFAVNRSTFDAGTRQRSVMVNGDTRHLDRYVKPHSVDCIVTDLPYGVRHRSHRSAAQRERSPDTLVEQALGAWMGVLRPRGAVGVAWNTRLTPRKTMVTLFEGAGLEVLDDSPYTRFEHRVDQSIVRDLLIARRPAVSSV